jgi:hypothetical protein
MKLAETAGSRWVIALVSVAFGATAIVAVSKTCTKSRAAEVTAVKKTGHKQWRGCKQRNAVKLPRIHPAHESRNRNPTGSDYREVLLAAKPAFDACTTTQPGGVTYEIRMPIGPDGHVMSVEVRGASADISKVSMKVVKCLETAVAPLRFPATGAQTFVSTNIRTE